VWFDAPIGYMSITNKYTKEWKKWWQPADQSSKVELFQFMAKDNVNYFKFIIEYI
jgi:methionyl-tRNA synthetase